MKFIFNKYSKKISLDDRLINEEVQTLAKNMEIIEEFNLSEIEIFYALLISFSPYISHDNAFSRLHYLLSSQYN